MKDIMAPNHSEERCKLELKHADRMRKRLPQIVDGLVATCGRPDSFEHLGPEPIPDREEIVDIVRRCRRILFPGYFGPNGLDQVNLAYYMGQEATALYEAVREQITLTLRHECVRRELDCIGCEETGRDLAYRFMETLPDLRLKLGKDVRAAYDGDPAAKAFDDIIFSYPGLFAITVYRIAHELHHLEVPLLPRVMTEHAHGATGIDINPGAHIGDSFFIDHGTGVVIGETTEIGDRVRIYQGVTLGALSLPKEAVDQLRSEKRHPTIEDDVIIYSGATILGGGTTIGARSVIGGNVWITESVPPDTRVFIAKPELIYKGNNLD
jgi:serine O-acetyltransferase